MKFKRGDICWDENDEPNERYVIKFINGDRYYYSVYLNGVFVKDHHYPVYAFDIECELSHIELNKSSLAIKLNKHRIVKITDDKIIIDLTKK